MNVCRTLSNHLKKFKDGQNALEFLRKIRNNAEIVRVLSVYAKHVRKRGGGQYTLATLSSRIMPGLQVLVVDLLKKSRKFWDERVKPELFSEGLNVYDPL